MDCALLEGSRRGLRTGSATAILAIAFAGTLCLAEAQTPRRAPADARLAEAAHALSAGDADRALALVTDQLTRNPADPRARVLAARVHISRGDFDAAYLQLRRAVRASPRDVDVLYYLGLVSGRLAERQFERLVQIAPESARVHQLQAESLEAQEKRSAAETEYEAALKANPDLMDALLALGKLKRIRLACEEAIALYEKAETIRPTFEGAYGLGVCYSYLQRDDEAAVQFEQAIRRDPKAAVAWVGLGTSLTKTGRATDAIPKLQQAVTLEPKMGEAYYALGMAYQSARQPALAQKAFQHAQQLGGTLDAGSPPATSPSTTPPPR